MPDNYFGEFGNGVNNYEPNRSYLQQQDVSFYQGRPMHQAHQSQEYKQDNYAIDYYYNGQTEGYNMERTPQTPDNQYYADSGQQWQDWGNDQSYGQYGHTNDVKYDPYYSGRKDWSGHQYKNQGGRYDGGANKYGNGYTAPRHAKNNQNYNNYGGANQMNAQQIYRRDIQQQGGGHRGHGANKNDAGYNANNYPNNLNFNYRLKADGQLYTMGQHPLQMTYSKNLIPDISAFSRSEPSIEVRRRKKSFSDSDLVAELSDRHSEDIENSRRKREMKGKYLHKTKSNDDLEFSDLANIKIEGLIQRKFGYKSQEKKSQPTVTDKQSKPNSETKPKRVESKDRKPGFVKPADDSTKKEGPTPERRVEKKAVEKKPAIQKTEKTKTEKANPDKAPKKDDAAKIVVQQKTEEEKADETEDKYNKSKLVAILEDLINTGRFEKSKVKTFDKFDKEFGKTVKYVRIEILKPSLNNDHFISLKPDVPANKYHGDAAHKDYEGKKHHAYNADKRDKPVDHGQGNVLMPSNQAASQQLKIAETKQLASSPSPIDEPPCPDESLMSVVEQAMHKTMTGKLQRNIRKMTDEEKITLFKQLKSNLHELATNPFGRYVLVLLLKTNITAIVDALIAYFDKRIMDIIKHKNGLLLSQSLIDLKFKDVRLRRSLKRIDKHLNELMVDENAPSVILIYANQLPPSEMEDFVEYCKSEYPVCLGNSIACKIFAKVFSKVSDVDRLEIELNIKTIMPEILDGNYGKELVEIFFIKADPQNLLPLKKMLFERLDKYLISEEYDYFFSKAVELKRTDLIDSVLIRLFKDRSFSDTRVFEIINHETGYKVILSFFTLASLGAKDLMRQKLNEIRANQEDAFTSFGKKVLSLCDSYFSSASSK